MIKFINAENAMKCTDFVEFSSYLKGEMIKYNDNLNPTREFFSLPDISAVWLNMSILDRSRDAFLVKLVSEYQKNPSISREKVTGITMLARASTGEIMSLMDSNFVTGLRTGVQAALYVKMMHHSDGGVLGIIGSGNEAYFIGLSILKTEKFESVVIYSPNEAHRQELSRKLSGECRTAYTAESADAVITISDVLVLATNSSKPVISGKNVKKGAIIVSIGTLPDRKELDEESIKRAKTLTADLRSHVLKDSGDMANAIKKKIIYERDVNEFREIIRGMKFTERKEGDLHIFKSVGYAELDLIAALYLHEKAEKLGLYENIHN
jgi:ornithine cyclodeaminase/alanine dehydrogenase-like protein (mu-crystallin family)